MPKINIQITVNNEEENHTYETTAILQDEVLKYIENNNTTVLYNYKNNSLVRKNEELRMDYLFDVNRKTEGTIEIKEIGKSIVLPIKTKKLERKNNNIEVEFEIDQKNFLYKIEEKI